MGRPALFVVTLLLVTGVLTGLVARGQPTIEEETLLKAYTDLSLARVYDEVCQPQARILNDAPENLARIHFSSTTSLLEMRLERVMLARKPHLKEDGAKVQIEEFRDSTAAAYRHLLKQDGCDSQAAQRGKNAFTLYTTEQPGLIIMQLDQAIREMGGTIIPYVQMDKGVAAVGH